MLYHKQQNLIYDIIILHFLRIPIFFKNIRIVFMYKNKINSNLSIELKYNLRYFKNINFHLKSIF